MSDTSVQEMTIDPSSITVMDMFGSVLQARLQSGALEMAITKQVDNLIDETAKDVFRSYNDVGKKLKELIAASVTPALDSIDQLPNYHEFVVNRVRVAAQNFYDSRLQETLDKELAQIISEIPDKVTLSWILEQIIESQKSECSCDGTDFQLPMIIEDEGRFVHIYINDSENTGSGRYSSGEYDKYRYKYQIHLSEGEIYSLKVGEKETKDKLTFGQVYGVEKKLFHLYAMKGKVELDHGNDPEDYDRHVGPEYD